jgi:hypothetical protein
MNCSSIQAELTELSGIISLVSDIGQDGNITKFYPTVEMGQAININE